jgi:hypothetical protein
VREVGHTEKHGKSTQSPLASDQGTRSGDHLSPPPNPRTHGGRRSNQGDHAVEESIEEDHVEEFYGQLWSIPPSPKKDRASYQGSDGGHLVWIRSDLVRSRSIRVEDCFLVGKHERIIDKSKKISFSCDIWAGGSRATFAEALKQFPMVERGRWVWQPERPRP